jgi:hypothetical protein
LPALAGTAQRQKKGQHMRHSRLPAVLLSLLLASCGGSGDNGGLLQGSTVALIGDMPYGTAPTDTSQTDALPTLIAAVNGDPDVSQVLHAGDIHSGSQFCTEAYDRQIFGLLQTFQDPLVYTPGDNEWTDCHKAKEGGGTYSATTGTITYVVDSQGSPVDFAQGDPAANLALVRSIFFAKPGSALGAQAMTVHTQAQEFDAAFPADKQFVENVWWEKSGVLFATANVPGGSNNDTDPWYGAPGMSAAQSQEVAERSAADLRWIDLAFQKAKANGDVAVLLMLQADMWDLDGKTAAHIAQYKQFIDRIAANTRAFGKPVLLVNGDSHVYRSDNPLQAGAACATESGSGVQTTACSNDDYANQPNGYNVPNFHRIVVHGSTPPLEWIKMTIDPQVNVAASATAFGPFSWSRRQP